MKRYWLIVFHYNNNIYNGTSNIGFISDESNPLNNKTIKNILIANHTVENLSLDDLVVTNIVEFKSELDYKNFWS